MSSRDEWVRRIGPAYPLLVAYRFQSRLPLAPALEPTQEDVHRARPWMLLIGLMVGVVSFVLAVFLGARRGTPLAAAGVSVLSLWATAGYFEWGLASVSEKLLTDWGMKSSPMGQRVAASACVFASLLIPFAALTSLPAAGWLEVILSAHILSRWCCLLSDLSHEWRRDTRMGNPPRWVSFTLASVAGVAVVVSLGATRGFFSVAFAAVCGVFVGIRVDRSSELRQAWVAAGGAITYLVTYLLFSL